MSLTVENLQLDLPMALLVTELITTPSHRKLTSLTLQVWLLSCQEVQFKPKAFSSPASDPTTPASFSSQKHFIEWLRRTFPLRITLSLLERVNLSLKEQM